MKIHLRRVVSTHKLTFEEFTTILTQIESCLNSRPLVPLQCDEDSIEALTPGHFLSGEPPESISDPALNSPIILYLYYGVGTYVKLLFATSGRDGPQNTSPHSDATPSGTIPLEMSKLEMLLSSKKTMWFPLSGHLPRLFKHMLERTD